MENPSTFWFTQFVGNDLKTLNLDLMNLKKLSNCMRIFPIVLSKWEYIINFCHGFQDKEI